MVLSVLALDLLVLGLHQGKIERIRQWKTDVLEVKRLYGEIKEHLTPTQRAELCGRVAQHIRQIQVSVKLSQTDPATSPDHEYSFSLLCTFAEPFNYLIDALAQRCQI